MDTAASDPNTPPSSLPTRAINDHRATPSGVLPRHLQTWLMAGLAAVIVLIILITGHSTPVPRTSTPPAAPTPATADRIRGYQRQLEEEQRRQVQLEQQQAALEAHDKSRSASSPSPTPVDPAIDEQHRRELHSLFADNVAFTRRTTASMELAEHAVTPSETRVRTNTPDPTAVVSAGKQDHESTPSPASSESTTAAPVATTTTHAPHREYPAAGPRLRVSEGTVIETTLLNRLDGTFPGPVQCLVTTPVYSFDRQHVLIPAGARVIGASTPVQNWGESRLAVTFHRLLMPDGHTYTLDAFKGLDQIGATGLRDEVNRHYLQVFGASIAIGAIAGLAQVNTRTGIDTTFGDAYRQSAGASLGTSSSRVLDRYLNVLPTVTIREGFRIAVYLTNDLELPAYNDGGGGR